jgi:hypothetical protein
MRNFENYLFDLSNMIKMVTIYKTMIFSGKKKGAGAGAAGRNFGSGSGRQSNFVSSAPAPQHLYLV